MAQYFRIKEISGPATVLRQGNLLNIELGHFIYPDEVDTIVSDTAIVYWNDNTGETFTWTPGTVKVQKPNPKPVEAAPVASVVETPAETQAEVVPAPLAAGSEDTQA
jgi:hypothetical protein